MDNVVWSLSYHNNSVAVGFGPGIINYLNRVSSESGGIIILNAITGSQIAVLSGHTGGVSCLNFSLDGESLASGGDDMTVKLWDIQTGGVVKTFHGHTRLVLSVSISADSTRIASGSRDKTVCLWDIQTRECLCTIEHKGAVQHICFSPMNPQHLISTSGNEVQWWNVNGHQIPPAYDGSHISFSPDHTQFALCNQKVITVQVSDSRAIVAEFHVANKARYCCFSPNGRFVAAAVGNTVYIWDITNPDPHLVKTFIGHINSITSLVFSSSSSLISASVDKSVKFWKIGALPANQCATEPGSTPITLPSIQTVSLQPRTGIGISCDCDGVLKTWDLSTGVCKESFQIPAASGICLSGRDAQMIDGNLIFVWYKHPKVYIWDTSKDELLQTLDTPECIQLRISGDESKIFFLLGEGFIQAWSMQTWEPVGKVELGLEGTPYLDSLYIDSLRVYIHTMGSSAQEGWDFGTSPILPFDPTIGRPHLDFIGGTIRQTYGPSWIKDSGKKVFQLSGRYAKPNDVQWDGQYLVAGYESGEVLILDFDPQ